MITLTCKPVKSYQRNFKCHERQYGYGKFKKEPYISEVSLSKLACKPQKSAISCSKQYHEDTTSD